MGLCGEQKKKKTGKVIIVPKGTINPNEINVIEIPLNMDTNSSLVVRASSDPSACLTVEPYKNPDQYSPQPRAATDLTGPNQQPPSATGFTPSAPPLSSTTNQQPPPPIGFNLSAPPLNQTISQPSAVAPATPGTTMTSVTPETPASGSSPQGCSTSGTQTSHVCRDIPRFSPPAQSTNLHSPICPICRPYYPNLLSSSYPAAARYCRHAETKECFLDICKGGSLDPTRITSAPKNQSETALLSKALEDKIDQILKPLLLSLVKSNEEREIFSKSSGTSMDSLYERLSRDRFVPKRRFTRCPSYDRMMSLCPGLDHSYCAPLRRCWWKDYDDDSDDDDDDYCRRKKNKTSKKSNDEDSKKKKTKSCSPTMCPYRKNSDEETKSRASEVSSERSIRFVERSSTDLLGK